MQRLIPTRTAVSSLLLGARWFCAVLLVAMFAIAANAQTTPGATQRQYFQQPPQLSPQRQVPLPPRPEQGQRGQHIGPWLASHQNLTPEQQQRALAQEPGFNSLPLVQQQHMQQRLSQLNSMSPEKRQRTVDHIEAMERLTPDQRTQVRGALADLGSLPPDRRHAVARSFHNLRSMPPDQRQQVMRSPQFRSEFSDQERGTLTNLMTVEPYLPPPPTPTH
jgi:hypothetical protein